MGLIAAGIAGYDVSLRPFLEEQKHDDDNNNEEVHRKLEDDCQVFGVVLIGAITHPFINHGPSPLEFLQSVLPSLPIFF